MVGQLITGLIDWVTMGTPEKSQIVSQITYHGVMQTVSCIT